MIKETQSLLVVIGLILAGVTAAEAGEQKSAGLRPSYFPNTEELQADEMRITALGTGLPTPLTRAQKNSAWLVELGNGDMFLFDIGSGSMENLFCLRPDFQGSIKSPPRNVSRGLR